MGWFAFATAVLPAIVVVLGVRLSLFASPFVQLRVTDASRMILLAWLINIVAPAKIGDFAKAFFLNDKVGLPLTSGLAVVALEKVFELVSILGVCSFGLLMLPPQENWQWIMLVGAATLFVGSLVLLNVKSAGWTRHLELPERFLTFSTAWVKRFLEGWRRSVDGTRVSTGVGISSLALSLLVTVMQLGQIWLLAVALGVMLPWAAVMGLMPVAILVGFLPLSLAGVGTRDAAIVLLFTPYMPPEQAAALGLLVTLRYVILALMGLPAAGEPISNLVKRTQAVLKSQQDGSRNT